MVPHSSTKKCVVDILLEVIHRVLDDGSALQERRAGRKSVLSMSCWRSFRGSQIKAPYSRTEKYVVDVLLEVIHRVNVLSMSCLRSFIGSMCCRCLA